MRGSTIKAATLAFIAGGLATAASAQVLYDNGPLVTTPTGACIPAGAQASEVQVGNINAGYNASSAAGFRVADDFTITGAAANVTGVRLYSYQTGAPTTASPYTAATVQIWNGDPASGTAMVVAGDSTTNVLTSSTFSNIYRYFNATCATNRAIWQLDTNLTTTLQPGTYWLDWDFTGSASFSGPWAPPTTYTGFPGPQPPHAPGNAEQLIGGAWSPVVDSVPQDFAFTILGGGGGGGGCYANCDHSTNVPFLNVNDFICFQAAFAAGMSYANCDNSTNPPVLNVNDFICFQAAFAAGCTAP